jgi:predicted transposase/invertase (TIGR01784 family)
MNKQDDKLNDEKESKFPTHDSFLKKAFEDPAIAQSFFKQHLPERVKAIANLSTLKLEKESFVEENLKKKISDILFSVQFEGETGYFYLLLEAQSTVDYYMAYRLLNYMMGIWQRHRTEHPKSKHLPLIYPIIFYHSSKPYNAPRSFFDLFKDPIMAQEFLNKFDVIDVNQILDEEFKNYPQAGIVEFFLKKHKERNMLKLLSGMQDIWDRLSISIEQKEALIKIILWYNIDKIESDNDKDQVIDYVNKKLAIEGDKIMKSIATQWRQEGIQEGIQEGMQQSKIQIAKAMLNKKQDVIFIAEITGLTPKEILALKSK